MADRISVYRLTPDEKNKVSSYAELAMRSDPDKEAVRVWEDLYVYIEEIINDVAMQCASHRPAKKKIS